MSDSETEALGRLDAALDRIAAAHAAALGVDPAPLAARLDRLIAQLHDALETPVADGG